MNHLASLSPNDRATLNLVREGRVYADYFFSRVTDFKWFLPLKEEGLFDARIVPGPIETDSEKHLFRIPFWGPLHYFMRLSELCNDPHYDEIVDHLLDVITEVSRFRDDSDRAIDNYHVWTAFTKVLSRLPPQKISVDILKFLPVWLSSTFDTSLVTAALVEELLPHVLTGIDEEAEAQSRAAAQATAILKALTDFRLVDSRTNLTPDVSINTTDVRLFSKSHWLQESLIGGNIASAISKLASDDPIMAVADNLRRMLLTQPRSVRHEVRLGGARYECSFDRNNLRRISVEIGQIQASHSGQATEETRSDVTELIEHVDFGVVSSEQPFAEASTFNGLFRERWTETVSREVIAQISEELLLHLYHWLWEDYSYISIRDLSSDTDRHFANDEATVMLVLRKLVISKAVVSPTISTVVTNLTGSLFQSHIFRRIVLSVISENWEQYKSLFWQLCSLPNPNFWFTAQAYETELFLLLEKNVNAFTNEEKEHIQIILNMGRVLSLPEDDTHRDRRNLVWRQKWYSALKSDPYFLALFNECRQQSNRDIEVAFREPSSQVGPGKSPRTVEELVSVPPNELAAYLREYRSQDQFRGPNVNALAQTLGKAAGVAADHFTDNLDCFLGVGYLYVYELLGGVKQAWIEHKELNWGSVLSFLIKYVDRPEFWENSLKVEGDHWTTAPQWIISEIASLIQEGTARDDLSFDHAHDDVAIRLLRLVWVRLGDPGSSRTLTDTESPVNFTANSTVGKILHSSLYLSMRIARDSDRTGDNTRWHPELKALFEQAVIQGCPEALTLLGWRMQQLRYLDSEWTERQVQGLCLTQDTDRWDLFLYGYLFGSHGEMSFSPLTEPIYRRAVRTLNDRWDLRELLVNHIGISYLTNPGDFPSQDLFDELIRDRTPSVVEKLIGFFSQQSRQGLSPTPGVSEPVIGRVMAFWDRLHAHLKSKVDANILDESDRKILGSYIRMTGFLGSLDESAFDKLEFMATHGDLKYDTPDLLEHLHRLMNSGEPEETAFKLAKILDALTVKYLPEWRSEHIRDVVQFIYQHGDGDAKRLADQICEKYFSKGILFLRDIWDVAHASGADSQQGS